MSRLDQNGGRLLVRPSGTEPLIRVMAEGEDPSLIGKLVDELGVADREGGRLIGGSDRLFASPKPCANRDAEGEHA